jgi:hypothetical protein
MISCGKLMVKVGDRVDAREYAMVFNSEGMYRGMKCSDGRNEIAVYK